MIHNSNPIASYEMGHFKYRFKSWTWTDMISSMGPCLSQFPSHSDPNCLNFSPNSPYLNYIIQKITKDGDMADVDRNIDEFQMENELAG